MMITSNHTFAQLAPHCPLRVDIEPQSQLVSSSAKDTRQDLFPFFASWQDLDNLRLSDEKHAKTSLDGYQRSTMTFGDNMIFNIPEGAEITGVEIFIEGHAIGSGIAEGVLVQLLNSQGEIAGENKAAFAIPTDRDWPTSSDSTDFIWRYGSQDDNWGLDLNQFIGSNPNLGYVIQVRNRLEQPIDVFIDHIEIVVHYTPLYTICKDHACVPFYIDDANDPQITYQWHIPQGWEMISDSEYDAAINIEPSYADLGIYEICVESFNNGDSQGICCRDFSYADCNSGSISGKIFLDQNGNFSNDVSDIPQENVLLNLYSANGDYLSTTNTDVDGKYSFLNIFEGEYYIEVELNDEFVFVVPKIGNDQNDSDITNENGIGTTQIISINPGEEIIDIDGGLSRSLTIGNFVWEDLNGDGVQQFDEPGIPGVTVRLSNSLIGELTSTTDENGFYYFLDIPSSDYIISFDSPSNFLTTQQNNGNAQNDNDYNGIPLILSYLNGGYVDTIDAGFYKFSSIGDFVWEDLNENGAQDINEPGIQGVTLSIINEAGTQLSSTTSDENGAYQFSNLVPGSYTINVVAEDFLTLTDNQATTTDLDSDGIIIDNVVTTNSINIISNTQNNDIDFGFFFKPVTISGFTWIDLNNDGQFQVTETTLSSVSVSLFDANGILVDQMLSDASGNYIFEDQKAGSYYIHFELPDGSVFTQANSGNDNSDSDVDGTNGSGTTSLITLMPGEISDNNSAGYIILPSVQGLTWEDLDANGVRNSNDDIIANIDVNLRSENGDLIASQSTNNQGIYQFENLPIGNYYIEFVKTDDLQFTTHIANTNLNSDVDGVISDGATAIFTLSGNQNLTDIDAGFFSFGSIGDFVWEDLNENGAQDINEPGIQGVSLSIIDDAGTQLSSTTSDENGAYQFSNLVPGSYTINVVAEDFLTLTDNQATTTDLDSDGIIIDNVVTTNPISIISNTQNNDIDFGFFFKPVTISGFTWIDLNNDGQFQVTETTLSSVNVSLFDANGILVDQMLSDVSGNYIFEDQKAGSYYIHFELPDGSVFTLANSGNDNSDSDVDGTNGSGSTSLITLMPGEISDNNSAGYIILPSVQGLTWEDLDANGVRNNNDNIIANIDVNLRSENGDLIASQSTNNQGIYQFESLPIGNYYIEFVKTDDLQFTTHIANTNLNSDVDGVISDGATDIFTLSGNQNLTDIDAGFFTFGSIGDFVWEDLNENGAQDINEPGIQGVTLSIMDDAGTQLSSTTSDENGAYQFSNLVPGSYTINVVADDFLTLTNNQATAADLDSDGIIIDNVVTTNPISILSNTQNNDIDFGFFFKPVTISGFTWIDLNNDGQFQVTETTLSSVSVSLFDANGILVDQMLSDASGNYAFEDQKAGSYYIHFELPDGSVFTQANSGNDNSDSDVDGTNGSGSTSLITLMPGEISDNNSAGYIILPSVQGLTWEDLDANGVRNNNDNIITNIDVNLRSENGDLVASQTTNNQGIYQFESLPIGNYYIEFVKKDDLQFTTHIANTNLNSDVDGVISDGATAIFTLSGNQNLTDIDAGFFTFGSIGDFVWEDLNENGAQDINEPGIQGVTLSIIDDAGTQLSSTTSDENGAYQFSNLVPGSYTINVVAENFLTLTTNQATTADLDSDGIIIDNVVTTNPISIISNTQNNDIDFGFFFKPVTISGFTWIDLNNDGQFQVTETTLSSVNVSLFDANGILVDQMLSDASGNYAFEDQKAGSYYIHFELPDGSVFTLANSGNDNSDSDVDGTNGSGTTSLITLMPGEISDNNSAGYIILPSVQGLTWEDLDANGVRNNNDNIIANIDVNLRSENGDLIASQTTNNQGIYQFESLPIGNYYIEFVKTDDLQFTTHIANTNLNSDVDGVISDGATAIFTLSGNQNLTDIDAGFYKFSSIGDFVWEDLNENGAQDINEPGIQGVTLSIIDAAGTQLSSTTSDENGAYQFSNLVPGSYTINVVAENFLTLTTNQATTTDLDSDGIIIDNVVTTNPINIISNTQNNDIDFGFFFKPVTISGFTWIDLNNDGQFQVTETTLSSVNVSLFDANGILVDQMLSDASGNYIFEDQKAGSYYIHFELPDGSVFTLANSGNDNSDSDVDGTNGSGTTSLITLMPGEISDNNSAGYIILPSVQGLTWEDLDANGVRNNNDDIIANIDVNLRSENGDLIASQTTNNQGIYQFESLPIGNYYIEFVKTDDLEFTTHIANTNLNSDVDGAISDGATAIFTLSGNQNLTDIDAGFFTFGSIGDFVWEDLNENGAQDINEPGIQGVTLSIIDAAGTQLSSTTSDENGAYQFSNLVPGSYTINVVADDFLTLTTNQATTTDLDSDGIIMGNIISTNSITILSNTQNIDIDFGFYVRPSTISGFTWLDENNDGQFQSSEQLLTGILVSLKDANGVLVSDMLSDINGQFSFEDVSADTYYLEFELPDGSIFSNANIGNDNSDSDVDGSNGIGTTANITLLPNEISLNNSAGYLLLPAVEGLTWEDLDANGIRNNNENIIANIDVNLRSENNDLIASQTTNDQGLYKFENLPIGNYYIEFVKTDDLEFTTHIANTNLNSDVDGVISSGATAIFTLSGNQNLSDVDAGFYSFGSIGDFVWEDLNKNGIQDLGEPGIQDVRIYLKDETSVILDSVLTDMNGNYEFADLIPGVYTLEVSVSDAFSLTENLSTNTSLNSDGILVGNIISTNPITINSDTQNADIDFGFYMRSATISGFTWIDENNDGQFQTGETLLSDILVSLFDTDGILVLDTLSDIDGFYSFDDIDPGTYYLQFELPNGSIFTIDNIGDELLDSDVDNTNGPGTTDDITLLPNQLSIGNSAGYILLPSVEGLTWEDLNGNGIRDINEPIISNIEVNLRNESDDLVATQTTNSQGIYKFENLAIDNYYIEFVKTQELEFTIHIADMDFNSDVDGIISTGATAIFALSGNQNLTDIDAGFYSFGSIGDFVWEDSNKNGIQDLGEPGIQDVKLYLKDDFGTVLDSTITDETGYYLFSQLAPGSYTIELSPDSFYTLTIANQGDEDLDSDATLLGGVATSDTVLISSGDVFLNVDFGFVEKLSTLGGFTWLDANNDGQLQTEETALSNVTVSIYKANGDFIEQTITSALGFYSFDNLESGDIYIVFESIDGHIFTTANQGDDLTDSDVTSEIEDGSTALINLTADEENLTYSAGYQALPKVGDYVWLDINNNGLQDDIEIGLNGVTIYLYNNSGIVIDSTVTSTNLTNGTEGYYLFDTLPIGEYYISFETIDTLEFTSYIDTELSLNSDITEENGAGTTDIFSLIGNQCNLDIDGGYSNIINNTQSINGEVWIDSDMDGVQNLDDKLVSGIDITLYNDSDIEIATTTSNSMGQYSFNGLDEGSYYIVFNLSERYMSTLPLQSSDLALDSDVDNSQAQGSTNIITLSGGNDEENIDAGLLDGAVKIDGFTWIDDNNSGIRESNELNLSNVEVKLFLSDGTLLDSVMVDSIGNYEFCDILAGEYYLVFENQNETFFNTEANQGPDELDDDLTNQISLGSTDIFTVSYFNELPPISGGYYQLGSIGDMAFVDMNNNGIQDEGSGLSGVVVHLINLEGDTLQTTVTSTNGKSGSGHYFFENIVPGEYQIQFIRPLTYNFIQGDIGTDDSMDSDVIFINDLIGTTDTILVTSNSMNNSIDAGFVFIESTGSSISGRIWDDENVNGLYELGENLRGFVTISLLDEMNNIIDTETSNTNGEFTFNFVPEGFYTLRASMIGNETATIPNIGVDDSIDSDFLIVGNEIETQQFFLQDSEDMNHIDLGIVSKIKIGDFVWEDLNNDGIQGNTEPGIINMPVTITDSSNTITEITFTDENGFYQFTDLPAGNYQVCVNIPEGYLIGKKDIGTEQLDNDANPDGCTDFMLFQSGTNNDIDLSMTISASISGVAFTDLNGNGTKNMFDPGIDDIPVFLYSNGVKIDSTITQTIGDSTGFYSFTELQVGEYYVVFDIPEEYLISQPNATTDDVDSDITNTFGIGSTDLITLESGDVLANLDGGAYLPACIGDRIWEDLDKNGIQDPGEPGIPGIEVIIFRSFGVPFDTVTSNENGDYKFSGLKQGLYFIQFVIPQEYTITLLDEGDDDNIDCDADETGKTPLISLAHGADLTSIDCGAFLSAASLRSVVWEDINGDGVRQHTEARIPDIRISLLNDIGDVIASTISNDLGLYAFQEIPVGDYKIFVDLATTTYDFTTIDAAGNDFLDSDIYANGESDIFTSGVVLSVPNVDVGLFETGSIGGFAWYDENQNGIYDLDENNLSNVNVSLYNESNEMVSKLVTTIEGDENISFTDLRPGQYRMVYKFNEELEASLDNGEIEVDNNSDIHLNSGIYSSPIFTVESSNIVTHIDAGFYTKPIPPANIESPISELEDNELKLSIHPNPATNYIRVDIANKENASVKVLNTDKRVVLEASATQMEQIDLRDLHPGVYYITVEQNGNKVTKKFIKIH